MRRSVFFFAAQCLADGIPELIHAEGFTDKTYPVNLQQTRRRVGLSQSRTQEHRQLRAALAETLEGAGGVFARHHQVENDQVNWLPPIDDVERLVAGRDTRDAVAGNLQEAAN